MSTKSKICIIGGVAGGASTAARLRRLCENCDIKVFERGPYASFANCGLPYRVGNVITDDSKLIVASPKLFKDRFNIEVLTNHEVLKINRSNKTIRVRTTDSLKEFDESYDKLVIAVGSSPFRPPWPGVNLPNIFVLRNIPDMKNIMARIDAVIKDHPNKKNVLVVGGGFIGLEMVDNLRHLGLEVTIIEKLPYLMAQTLPPDLSFKLKLHIESKGVKVVLGDGIASFTEGPDGIISAQSENGLTIESYMVILAVGAQPESQLAKDAGLELGVRGSIKTDDELRTSDPDIYAVGDVIETEDIVTHSRTNLPLAGPANRQGRTAANSIKQTGQRTFRGVQGTSICRVFDVTVANTGATEASLRRAGITDFLSVDIHPGSHASYFPGATPMAFKMQFRKSDGKVLGVQGIGNEGIDTRIDVVAMAIQMGATVHNLAEAELCYAPQFGAAKDPINMLGFIAMNALEGKTPIADWALVPKATESDQEASVSSRHLVVDVRRPDEFAKRRIPGSINVPLEELRSRLDELRAAMSKHLEGNPDQPILVTCQAGQRGHYAVRLLRQLGFDARNISGGINTYCLMNGIAQ